MVCVYSTLCSGDLFISPNYVHFTDYSLQLDMSLVCDCLCKFLTVQTFFARVLMLRRKAAPTETKLHDQYSNMVNEALEMMESHPERTTESTLPFSSTDSHAQL